MQYTKICCCKIGSFQMKSFVVVFFTQIENEAARVLTSFSPLQPYRELSVDMETRVLDGSGLKHNGVFPPPQ